MVRPKDVLVNIISKTIVRSQNTCLASSQNTALIEINRARDIDISNVQIMQKADATSRCSQNINIDIGSLQYDVSKVIDAAVQVAADDVSTTLKLKNDMINAFEPNDVNSCLSSALNDFKIQLGDVTGTVNIQDLKLSQVAEAKITKCIQEGVFKIGAVPMGDYIESSLSAIKSAKIKIPDEPCGDPKTFNILLILVVVIALGVVSGLALWHFFTFKTL